MADIKTSRDAKSLGCIDNLPNIYNLKAGKKYPLPTHDGTGHVMTLKGPFMPETDTS
jgi:hypothetical protein